MPFYQPTHVNLEFSHHLLIIATNYNVQNPIVRVVTIFHRLDYFLFLIAHLQKLPIGKRICVPKKNPVPH